MIRIGGPKVKITVASLNVFLAIIQELMTVFHS